MHIPVFIPVGSCSAFPYHCTSLHAYYLSGNIQGLSISLHSCCLYGIIKCIYLSLHIPAFKLPISYGAFPYPRIPLHSPCTSCINYEYVIMHYASFMNDVTVSLNVCRTYNNTREKVYYKTHGARYYINCTH